MLSMKNIQCTPVLLEPSFALGNNTSINYFSNTHFEFKKYNDITRTKVKNIPRAIGHLSVRVKKKKKSLSIPGVLRGSPYLKQP